MNDRQQVPPYQWLLEQFPVFFLTTDEHGHIQAVNKEASDLASGEENLHGKLAEEIFPGIALSEVLKSRKGDWNGRLQLPGGEELIMAKLPLFDHDGKLTGAAAIGAKVREVIRLAEKHANLDDLTVLFEGILNVFTEPFSIADAAGHTWFASDSCLQLLGERSDLLEVERSIHRKVQLSRRPVHRERAVGKNGDGSLHIRAVPLMLDGKLKGSIAVYETEKDAETHEELLEARRLIRRLEGMRLFADFPVFSSAMRLAVEQGRIAAHTAQPVLLRGEPGTGKRHFAEAIHNESESKFGPLLMIDCRRKNDGLFPKRSEKGTVLLENVDALGKRDQQRLLGELQKKEQNKPRLICTTTANIEQAVVNGKFSKDLYGLLNRLTIHLPPLRDREADLAPLVDRFVMELNRKLGRHIESVAPETLEKLGNQAFPNNIAELKVTLESAMLRSAPGEKILQLAHFPDHGSMDDRPADRATKNNGKTIPLQDALENFEKGYIQDIYRKSGYNKTKTAELLNISIRNLYYKMDKYNIDKNSMQ